MTLSTSRISDALGHFRLARGLPDFLREPVSREEAKAYIRERMRERPQGFLRMLERCVFGHPRSPYLALFRSCGCEPGDVRRLVAREGVEGTLRELLRQGIYVTVDEFKGRVAAVRGSRTFEFRA